MMVFICISTCDVRFSVNISYNMFMKEKFITWFYDLTYPKPEHKAVYPYRLEFLFERTKSNLEHLWYLLLASQVVETVLLFNRSFIFEMKLSLIIFLFINLILTIAVYRFRKENYGVRYKTLLHTQSIIILNILFITSAFNIFQNEKMVMVHIYIIAYVFISIVLHIPSANLALIGLISLFLNIIGILMYHFDPLIVQFEIINLLIFIGLSWWLGIIANRNRILLWMNLNKERELNSKLADLNKRDSMTNFFNHEYIFELLDQEIERAHLLEQCLSIAIFDLDDFKRINDTYGHQEGDKVLLEVSLAIKESVRDADLIGRYGGEEFMVIFPATANEQAEFVANRIRTAVEALNFENYQMTISGGVAELLGHNSQELIKIADTCLYRAKHQGKNCIISQY